MTSTTARPKRRAGYRTCTLCRAQQPTIEFTRAGPRICNSCGTARLEGRAISKVDFKVAAPRRIETSTASGIYTGTDLAEYDGRPGAMDAYRLPSRVGKTLRWRDGRISKFESEAA